MKGAIPSWLQPLASVFPLRSTFSNYDHLTRVKSRKLIFHGTNDQIVPLSSALKLKDVLSEGDEFIVIPEGTHRNLRNAEIYKQKLASVL